MMLSSSPPMPSEQPSRFGALIRQLRDERGWTQEKLAREADITVTSVSNVERGATKPNAETVEKLAAAFGLEPGDLDPRRLGDAVAASARTVAQRQAIRRLLALPDSDIEAIVQFLDERTEQRKGRRGK